MLASLDLFSGIGGIALGLKDYARPIAYCERNVYAAGILFSRMLDGSLPKAPIWPDIRTLDGNILPSIDLITAGFPCQDVSVAGKREGLDGKRTGLYAEAIRLIRECRPEFVFFENVYGIKKYVFRVRQELEELGYDCRDGFLSAAGVGAPHKRNRWWLLAYSNSKSLEGQWESSLRIEKKNKSCERHWWAVEPNVGRVANGIPFRVDRITGLGNSVVPQCAKKAFEVLMGF